MHLAIVHIHSPKNSELRDYHSETMREDRGEHMHHKQSKHTMYFAHCLQSKELSTIRFERVYKLFEQIDKNYDAM